VAGVSAREQELTALVAILTERLREMRAEREHAREIACALEEQAHRLVTERDDALGALAVAIAEREEARRAADLAGLGYLEAIEREAGR
jgi:lipid A disaccharide synthetase